MSDSEHKRGCKPVLTIADKEGSCVITKQDSDRLGSKQFTFDQAYSGDTTTAHIYSDIVCPIVKVSDQCGGDLTSASYIMFIKSYTELAVSYMALDASYDMGFQCKLRKKF